MNALKIILLIVFAFFANVTSYAQEATSTPERTTEQEATRQTEKLQQELNLNEEQTKQVHEINLKYARERQVSNSRSEALQRVKNKESDLQRILRPDQYNRLQNKQFERSGSSSPDFQRTMPTQSPSLRENNPIKPTYRTGLPVRNTYPRQISTQESRSQDKQAPTRNPSVAPDRRPTENSRNQQATQAVQRRSDPPTRNSEENTRSSSGAENRSTPTQVERSSGAQPPTRSGSQSSGRR